MQLSHILRVNIITHCFLSDPLISTTLSYSFVLLAYMNFFQMIWNIARFLCCVTVMLVSAATVRSDHSMQHVQSSATGFCPRWSCPCVESQAREARLFASKRDDPTSQFRRSAFYAARQTLLLTEYVLRRIVSNASPSYHIGLRIHYLDFCVYRMELA